MSKYKTYSIKVSTTKDQYRFEDCIQHERSDDNLVIWTEEGYKVLFAVPQLVYYSYQPNKESWEFQIRNVKPIEEELTVPFTPPPKTTLREIQY